MPAAISFTVEGNPIPTARPRTVKTKAGAEVTYIPKESRLYQCKVAVRAREANRTRQRLLGPVRLVVAFHRETKQRCDLDNLLKSVLDGLTLAGLWEDDSQVTEVVATKALSRTSPRAEVLVESIAEQVEIPLAEGGA